MEPKKASEISNLYAEMLEDLLKARRYALEEYTQKEEKFLQHLAIKMTPRHAIAERLTRHGEHAEGLVS